MTIFVFAWPYFSPVPLHRDYLLRLCARDGIASSIIIIIIIIRRLASSLRRLWVVVVGFGAYPRPPPALFHAFMRTFFGVFGTSSARRPSFLRSATTDASLPPSPVTFLLLFAGSLFVVRQLVQSAREGVVRSIPLVRSRQLDSKILISPSIFFAAKKIARFLLFLAGCFLY